MPLIINKVCDDGTTSSPITMEEGKALIESLIKVVACYRHLASCVGGCTDNLHLRCELQQTRERAHKLAVACRHHLTARLRDKTLPPEERQEMERLWVAFTSSLELLHVDMCKVLNMGSNFSLVNTSALVKTGIQGETREVAARALSLADLNRAEDPVPGSLEDLEQGQLKEEIVRVDQMLEDMEEKVNVPRWMVEARGPQYADPASMDSTSLGLYSMDEEASVQHEQRCERSQVFVILALCGVILVAAVLSVCVIYFS
ncbi:regulator of G-protein signaling 9-binding protein [Esox lucius]|uniref:Regulator of G protein signaling 9 binding protein n=1 Tax=Esox lucius TaxID=8010 RepID=A0A3P8YJU8_ESOLU|nr:regulator of G-protein signaling 9-binding protein [Esox lucius]